MDCGAIERTGLRLGIVAILIAAVCFLSSMATATAQTIEDTPVLIPRHPVAGQPVSVELHGTSCVVYLAPPDSPVVVTRNGNAITLLVQAYVSEDPIFCIYPDVPVSFAIGAFAPSNYAVQVDVQYDTFPEGSVTQTLGTLQFAVASLDSAPFLSGWGPWALIVLLLLVTATYRGIGHRQKNRSLSEARK